MNYTVSQWLIVRIFQALEFEYCSSGQYFQGRNLKFESPFEKKTDLHRMSRTSFNLKKCAIQKHGGQKHFYIISSPLVVE